MGIMPKLTIVIPCHNIEEEGYIFPCVQSIRETNPNAKILIVDSNSPDRSYIDKIGEEVLDVQNKNYAFGAYWHGFKHCHDSDYYLFTHDSTVLRGEITDDILKRGPMIPFYWFNDNNSAQWEHMKQWIISQARDNAAYKYEPGEACLFGGIFIASQNYMQRLEADGFAQIKPTVKMEAVYSDELGWSIAARANNIDIRACSLYGHLDDVLGNNKIIWKFSGTLEKGRR